MRRSEAGTGLAATFAPTLLVRPLLGVNVSADAAVVTRCFGVALLALGIACLPRRRFADADPAARRAMLIYNVLIASYLGALAHFGGALLWPAVALHAGVATALVWSLRDMPHADR